MDLTDVDADGYEAAVVGGDDCDDVDVAVHPGAPEVPYDGVDQDGSGGDLDDLDGDGFAAVPARALGAKVQAVERADVDRPAERPPREDRPELGREPVPDGDHLVETCPHHLGAPEACGGVRGEHTCFRH